MTARTAGDEAGGGVGKRGTIRKAYCFLPSRAYEPTRRVQRQRPKYVKAVLQAMIDGARVDARDQIEPTFRGSAVRIESGFMVRTDVSWLPTVATMRTV